MAMTVRTHSAIGAPVMRMASGNKNTSAISRTMSSHALRNDWYLTRAFSRKTDNARCSLRDSYVCHARPIVAAVEIRRHLSVAFSRKEKDAILKHALGIGGLGFPTPRAG